MPIKVMGYGRTSTDKQQLSPQVQEQMCRSWFEGQQLRKALPEDAVFVDMLMDKAVSARHPLFERPMGERVLLELDRGDYVVVSKFTRAFRSAGDAEASVDKLHECGINLVILDANIDSTTPNGRMMIGMLALVARWERDIISERTKEAMAIRRADGWQYTWPPCGFLWAKDPRNSKGPKILVPDTLVRELGEYSARLIYEGVSAASIAARVSAMPKYRCLVERNGRTGSNRAKKKPVWIHRATITRYAALFCLGWPQTTQQQMREGKFGDCLKAKFIRRHYPAALLRSLENDGLTTFDDQSPSEPSQDESSSDRT